MVGRVIEHYFLHGHATALCGESIENTEPVYDNTHVKKCEVCTHRHEVLMAGVS